MMRCESDEHGFRVGDELTHAAHGSFPHDYLSPTPVVVQVPGAVRGLDEGARAVRMQRAARARARAHRRRRTHGAGEGREARAGDRPLGGAAA
jgi:hypothetical protein